MTFTDAMDKLQAALSVAPDFDRQQQQTTGQYNIRFHNNLSPLLLIIYNSPPLNLSRTSCVVISLIHHMPESPDRQRQGLREVGLPLCSLVNPKFVYEVHRFCRGAAIHNHQEPEIRWENAPLPAYRHHGCSGHQHSQRVFLPLQYATTPSHDRKEPYVQKN